MWRTNFFYLSARIVISVALLFFLGQCQIEHEGQIPAPRTLMRGTLFSEPVVQTAPERVTTILLKKNKIDKLMANAPKELERPNQIEAYAGKRQAGLIDSVAAGNLPQHTFQWSNTMKKNVMVCIFKQVVRVDKASNQIENKQDLVWLWTPGKGNSDTGEAAFKQGFMAAWDEKTQQYQLSAVSKAHTLEKGLYVWFILAWDDMGVNITHASREFPIACW
jgi:hypothetical protein